MKILSFIITVLLTGIINGQDPVNYYVVHADTTYKEKFGFVFTNQKGDTITRLDTSKYFTCFSDTFRYFAIIGIKSKKGYWAIDINERPLFQVFNTTIGEPSPDEIREGMIRIVDNHGKIGFANYKGQVTIKPKFESASSFYKSKAIIGRQCRKVLWLPGFFKHDSDDKHYIIKCKQAGYINKRGEIIEIGSQTAEQVQKEIGWKSEYDD